MRTSAEAAERLPAWVRLLFLAVAVLFAALSAWLFAAPSEIAWTKAAGVAAGFIALLLFVSAARGRIWPWLYLMFG